MISTTEAAKSLRDIERVNRRTGVASAYVHASPHLIVWGAVWEAGYAGTGLTRPEYWGYVWAPLILIGAIGAFLVGRRGVPKSRREGMAFSPGLTSLMMSGSILIFMVSTYAVFRPTDLLPYLVFPALLVGLVYSLIGSLGMPRFLGIGVGVFAITMVGWLFARDYMAFWIAAAGGGGLMLGGLWLKKA